LLPPGTPHFARHFRPSQGETDETHNDLDSNRHQECPAVEAEDHAERDPRNQPEGDPDPDPDDGAIDVPRLRSTHPTGMSEVDVTATQDHQVGTSQRIHVTRSGKIL
jgi:hypothetical protein